MLTVTKDKEELQGEFTTARDKLQRSIETLENEKALLDERVRELTFKLEVRVEDLQMKEVNKEQIET